MPDHPTRSSTPPAPAHTAQLPTAPAAEPPPWGPGEYALLSALIPGAGQVAQRRWGAAVVQAATVVSYAVGAFALGGGRAFWLALAWNVWSAVDAYWHAPD